MDDTELTEWRKNLSVGDEVALNVHFPDHYEISKISEIAEEHIEVRGLCFSKSTGLAIEHEYAPDEILPVTPEIREEIERSRLLQDLNNISWFGYSTQTLRAVCDLIDKENEATT